MWELTPALSDFELDPHFDPGFINYLDDVPTTSEEASSDASSDEKKSDKPKLTPADYLNVFLSPLLNDEVEMGLTVESEPEQTPEPVDAGRESRRTSYHRDSGESRRERRDTGGHRRKKDRSSRVRSSDRRGRSRSISPNRSLSPPLAKRDKYSTHSRRPTPTLPAPLPNRRLNYPSPMSVMPAGTKQQHASGPEKPSQILGFGERNYSRDVDMARLDNWIHQDIIWKLTEGMMPGMRSEARFTLTPLGAVALLSRVESLPNWSNWEDKLEDQEKVCLSAEKTDLASLSLLAYMDSVGEMIRLKHDLETQGRLRPEEVEYRANYKELYWPKSDGNSTFYMPELPTSHPATARALSKLKITPIVIEVEVDLSQCGDTRQAIKSLTPYASLVLVTLELDNQPHPTRGMVMWAYHPRGFSRIHLLVFLPDRDVSKGRDVPTLRASEFFETGSNSRPNSPVREPGDRIGPQVTLTPTCDPSECSLTVQRILAGISWYQLMREIRSRPPPQANLVLGSDVMLTNMLPLDLLPTVLGWYPGRTGNSRGDAKQFETFVEDVMKSNIRMFKKIAGRKREELLPFLVVDSPTVGRLSPSRMPFQTAYMLKARVFRRILVHGGDESMEDFNSVYKQLKATDSLVYRLDKLVLQKLVSYKEGEEAAVSNIRETLKHMAKDEEGPATEQTPLVLVHDPDFGSGPAFTVHLAFCFAAFTRSNVEIHFTDIERHLQALQYLRVMPLDDPLNKRKQIVDKLTPSKVLSLAPTGVVGKNTEFEPVGLDNLRWPERLRGRQQPEVAQPLIEWWQMAVSGGAIWNLPLRATAVHAAATMSRSLILEDSAEYLLPRVGLLNTEPCQPIGKVTEAERLCLVWWLCFFIRQLGPNLRSKSTKDKDKEALGGAFSNLIEGCRQLQIYVSERKDTLERDSAELSGQMRRLLDKHLETIVGTPIRRLKLLMLRNASVLLTSSLSATEDTLLVTDNWPTRILIWDGAPTYNPSRLARFLVFRPCIQRVAFVNEADTYDTQHPWLRREIEAKRATVVELEPWNESLTDLPGPSPQETVNPAYYPHPCYFSSIQAQPGSGTLAEGEIQNVKWSK